MENLSVGSVVLISFPFSDLSSKKLRPCLILANAEFDDYVVCQITSKPYGSNNAINLTKSDFTEGELAVTSFIRPDKLATLDKSLIKRSLGIIKELKQSEVKVVLRTLLVL